MPFLPNFLDITTMLNHVTKNLMSALYYALGVLVISLTQCDTNLVTIIMCPVSNTIAHVDTRT